MKNTFLILAALAVFGTTSTALADATITTQTTTTSSTQSSTYYVDNDAGVVASLAALNAATRRYDLLVASILNHSQTVDYAAMEKHGGWFVEHPMTSDNLNGYIAYLEQRLHLDAAQESELTRIERHFMADVGPLYTAYQSSRLTAYEAWRATRLTVIRAETISTPVVETETTRTTTTVESQATVPEVKVKKATTRVETRFIRNIDTK